MADTMEDLVYKFLNEEDFTLRNALAYAGLGLAKTVGQANEIIAGVGFAGQQYSDDRQKRMAEILGELRFNYIMLASTLDNISAEEIESQYVASYEAIRAKKQREKNITIADMMEMKKHVKPGALLEKDSDQKKKWRERMR